METAALREASENLCIRIIKDGVASGDFRDVDARLATRPRWALNWTRVGTPAGCGFRDGWAGGIELKVKSSEIPAPADVAAYRAIDLIYHSYLTGLILMVSSRAGPPRAADIVFRTFRRQQLARFLPGLKKLGLDGLPHAVACAQYHYLSNQVGGVKVEYIYENDRKAWVRYPPPRWIWWGTAICGIPSEVSRAMLRGWHANNGVVLGNPRLGFVCTGQTVDGQPGLEGYYKEWDHDLAPEERLQFSPGERCPAFDPDRAPKLSENAWPEERLRKVLRNYSMEYITSIVPETIAALGPEAGGHLAGAAARLIGMHTFDEVASLLGGVAPGAAGFAKAFARLAAGQGDDAEFLWEGTSTTVRQTSWRLMSERESLSPAVFDAWNELWVGAALAHDRFMRVEVIERRDRGDDHWAWRFH